MEEKQGELCISAELVQDWLQCPPGVKLRGAKFDPFSGHLKLLFSGVGVVGEPGSAVPSIDLVVSNEDQKIKIQWPE